MSKELDELSDEATAALKAYADVLDLCVSADLLAAAIHELADKKREALRAAMEGQEA